MNGFLFFGCVFGQYDKVPFIVKLSGKSCQVHRVIQRKCIFVMGVLIPFIVGTGRNSCVYAVGKETAEKGCFTSSVDHKFPVGGRISPAHRAGMGFVVFKKRNDCVISGKHFV